MPKVGDTISAEDARLLPAKPHEIQKLVKQLDGRFRVRTPGRQVKRK